MIVEGYEVRNCDCSTVEDIEFAEIDFAEDHKNPKRFILICGFCGDATQPCKTKEQAVHKWNAAKKVLYG